ncbi:MAG: glycosyltransferase family 4 protein [Sulfolobales archaeon]
MVKPRITVFSKLFWPEGGGGELATYLIIKMLPEYFDVTIISGTEDPSQDILRVCKYIYYSLLRTPFKPFEWFRLFFSFKAFRKIVESSQVVYIPSHTLLPLAITAKRLNPKVKVIVHLHNYQPISYTSIYMRGSRITPASQAMIEYLENRSLVRALLTGLISPLNFINTLALYYSDKIITVSKAQLEILRQHLGDIMKKAHVIYNPLPQIPNIDKKPSEKPQLAYIGGASYVKGFRILLNATPRILRETRATLYVISGSRPFRKRELQALKKIQKKTSKLIIMERLSHQDYLKLHENLWALLFPSISEEPLPYAIIESMVMGTLPIASKVGGVPEIVEGTFAEGMLFSPDNVDEFIRPVEYVLSLNKEQLIDVGLKLREVTIKKFDLESIKAKLVRVFS